MCEKTALVGKVTWKVGRLSSPGKSSMSPVAMLKHAPCQGQRTCPFDNTPEMTGNDDNVKFMILHSFMNITIIVQN